MHTENVSRTTRCRLSNAPAMKAMVVSSAVEEQDVMTRRVRTAPAIQAEEITWRPTSSCGANEMFVFCLSIYLSIYLVSRVRRKLP